MAATASEPGVDVIRGPAEAMTLLDPTRRTMLEQLREPTSASSLARRLGLPRQRVNYHLRELEKAHLVKLVEERRKGNCIERVVQATARYYLISPEALGPLACDPERIPDRFSASYLVAAAGRTIRDLATLTGRARAAGGRLATLTLETEVRFAGPEARGAFAEELASALARLAAKYHDATAEGGRVFRFVVGGYPKITRNEDGSPGEPVAAKED
jgi:DNA-binding transcriptional ArsR family regulator